MPSVALIKSGPAGDVKMRLRGELRVGAATTNAALLCGYVSQIMHDSSTDSIAGVIMDDKTALARYTVIGRMCYDPHGGRHYWTSRAPIFNELGYPNCVDTPHGPRFAPGFRFGYSQEFGIWQGRLLHS